jgi:type IV secretory pathway VirB9-like protein
MVIAKYTRIVCTLLVFGGCVLQDPPALPDPARFVPPSVTLPSAPAPEEQTLPLLVEAVNMTPMVPPPDAVPVVFEPPRGRRGKHAARVRRPSDPITTAEQGSLLTPNHGGYAQSTSALLRYPYRTGAVYEVKVGVTHPVTLLLPPGLQIAGPPSLPTDQNDPKAWDVGFAEMGTGPERQEAITLRPASAGVEATTPLLTKSGHMFLIRLKSQEAPGVLMVTWELPLMKVLTPPGTTTTTPKGPAIDLARLHTQYRIAPGKTAVNWTPAEIYDDANMTVIRFTESLRYTAAPILTAVGPGGKAIPVEYTTYAVPNQPAKGEFYLTRGIYPRLQLRDGNGGLVTLVRLPTPPPAYEEATAHAR